MKKRHPQLERKVNKYRKCYKKTIGQTIMFKHEKIIQKREENDCWFVVGFINLRGTRNTYKINVSKCGQKEKLKIYP